MGMHRTVGRRQVRHFAAHVSTLEEPPFYAATEAEQRALAKWFADHIVHVECQIDGVNVDNIRDYRFSTAQFEFTAPTPWIFGTTGGTGKAVGDGYFLMVVLSKGKHTVHYSGTYRFEPGELFGKPLVPQLTLWRKINAQRLAVGIRLLN